MIEVLQDIVYMIIRPSGEVMEISCNNKYVNHYQYLQDFSKRNSYLIRNSFGLTFSRDDDTSKFFFFNMLIQDGNIIYENHKLFSNDNISSAQFYLPVKTTLIQKEILTAYQEEIDKIKCIFLEKYNEETESFYSLYENIDDLKQGSKLLMHYVDESLKGENSMGGR